LTLAIIAIVGAFIVFQPADSEDAPKSRSASDKTSSPPPKPQAPKATVIEVRGGKPVGGPKTITLQGGERADIEVTADESGNAHLHGYDIEQPFGPGTPARIRFETDIDGVFELEEENTKQKLASIEVNPR